MYMACTVQVIPNIHWPVMHVLSSIQWEKAIQLLLIASATESLIQFS